MEGLKIIIFLGSLLWILTLGGCDQKEEDMDHGLILPTSDSEKVLMYSYDENNKVKASIRGFRSLVYKDQKEVWLEKVEVLILDRGSDGKVVKVELTANEGRVNYENYNFEVWGDGVIIRENEVRIEGDRFYWNNEGQYFYTKEGDLVKVHRLIKDKGEVSVVLARGKNLLAKDALKTVEMDEVETEVPKESIQE